MKKGLDLSQRASSSSQILNSVHVIIIAVSKRPPSDVLIQLRHTMPGEITPRPTLIRAWRAQQASGLRSCPTKNKKKRVQIRLLIFFYCIS